MGSDARLLRRRSDPETEGAAIGVFERKLEPEELKALEKSVPEKVSATGPLPTGSPLLYFKLVSGARETSLSVPQTPERLREIQPLLAEIARLEKALLERPRRALRIELLSVEGRIAPQTALKAKVALANLGDAPLKLDLEKARWRLESMPPPPPPDPNITALPTVWSRADAAQERKGFLEVPPRGRIEMEFSSGVAEAGPLLARMRVTIAASADKECIEGETLSASIRVGSKSESSPR